MRKMMLIKMPAIQQKTNGVFKMRKKKNKFKKIKKLIVIGMTMTKKRKTKVAGMMMMTKKRKIKVVGMMKMIKKRKMTVFGMTMTRKRKKKILKIQEILEEEIRKMKQNKMKKEGIEEIEIEEIGTTKTTMIVMGINETTDLEETEMMKTRKVSQEIDTTLMVVSRRNKDMARTTEIIEAIEMEIEISTETVTTTTTITKETGIGAMAMIMNTGIRTKRRNKRNSQYLRWNPRVKNAGLKLAFI